MQSIYHLTVPAFVQKLSGLKVVLGKGAAHAKEQGLSEADMLNARLAPDMYPLKRQVQIACDHAKGCTARLAGKENPVMEDVEESFAELVARIDKTLAFVGSVAEADFAGADERRIVMKYFPPGAYLPGADYAAQHALPNFYFHLTTAYDILRHLGTPLGKADFLGAMPFKG